MTYSPRSQGMLGRLSSKGPSASPDTRFDIIRQKGETMKEEQKTPLYSPDLADDPFKSLSGANTIGFGQLAPENTNLSVISSNKSVSKKPLTKI